MKLKAPERITFTQNGFCPGCGHGICGRLIAEIAEEMNIADKLLTVVDVACCSLHMESWQYDTIMAAHGRPIPTAIGAKKVRKDNPVIAYLGDGAAYSIGMAEMMHAAIRNDNIICLVVNNSLYGMTGGQCAPTSLPGQKTTSSPYGKDPSKAGMPFRIEEAFSGLNIGYMARCSLATAKDIRVAKQYLKKAFEKHMDNKGFCLVEIMSPCPTNLNMTPIASAERITNEMTKYFPVGEFKELKEEE